MENSQREHNTKPNKTSYKKGQKKHPKSFGKGGKMPDSAKKKISDSLIGKKGEQARRWKGKNAGYVAFHIWLKKEYGKANKCEGLECNKKSKNYQWCLKKGYEHDHKKENYIMLCVSCHRKYDMTVELKAKIIKNLMYVK